MKISFKANQGAGLQIPFEGNGMKLEAECSTSFTLKVRATTRDNIFHALIVGADGKTYSGGSTQTNINDGLDIVPAGENPVSGKVEWAGSDGTNITLDYMAAYGTTQGDCVFTGLLFRG